MFACLRAGGPRPFVFYGGFTPPEWRGSSDWPTYFEILLNAPGAYVTFSFAPPISSVPPSALGAVSSGEAPEPPPSFVAKITLEAVRSRVITVFWGGA